MSLHKYNNQSKIVNPVVASPQHTHLPLKPKRTKINKTDEKRLKHSIRKEVIPSVVNLNDGTNQYPEWLIGFLPV